MTLTKRPSHIVLISFLLTLLSGICYGKPLPSPLGAYWVPDPDFDESSGLLRLPWGIVPLRDSGRPLVTGIDLDKVFSRYVTDYDRFERSPMGPLASGMIWRWRVKPLADDPETKYYWGSKRKDPYFKRSIRPDIGVFRSHYEALVGATFYLTSQQAYTPMDELNPNDPGFVSWGGGTYFVRDNVFYSLSMSPELNPAPLEQFHKELISGAEGITKGAEVPVPVIIGDGFPSDMTAFKIDGKPAAPLDVKDPNGRPVYCDLWVEATDDPLPNVRTSPPPGDYVPHRSPQIRWAKPNMVVVDAPGTAKVVDIAAVAMNDLCLVSVWRTRVRIAPPPEIQPKE